MEENNQKPNCIICGSSECSIETGMGFKKFVRCKKVKKEFFVTEDIFELDDEILKNKIYCLILDCLLHRPNPKRNENWMFGYSSQNSEESQIDVPYYINLYTYVETFPTNLMERTNRTLLNLSVLYPNYNCIFTVGSADMLIANASYSATTNRIGETMGFLKVMTELGYLKQIDSIDFRIPAQGWKKIEELRAKHQEINQGFVAMEFSDDTREIREAFRQVIEDECHYAQRIIDEKEHNNQIVPEIFYEIQRSKFVVVDVTKPNNGAYYEAGYAQALGKEVIVCCSKEAFESNEKQNRPHFDIAQKCMVVWEDIPDLKKRLKRRIEATVGINTANQPQSSK